MKTITQCWIYKSSRKSGMYLYLPSKDDFQDLPEALMEQFGTPLMVMQLDLHPRRTLSRADANQVIQSLDSNGYYLQLPPDLVPGMYHGNDL